ncbi:MAG: glycoside hydrolase family 5 protein, partial [Chloroflexota bacterium]
MVIFDHFLKLPRQRLLDQDNNEPPKMRTNWSLLRLSLAFSRIFIFLGVFLGLTSPSQAQTPNYLHTEGSAIVDSNGNRVILTGINWFGLETESFAPHGLWARSLESFLDQIQELGFNTIRLPYSNELFDPSSLPTSINYDLNPELEGLTGLEIMDKIIEGAGSRGIRVILDRHRPNSHAQSELWYTDQVDEERWISDWVMLAERYRGNDTVIGMDLHNEPHGPATWGTGDLATDWRLAAERAGNAILAVNPNLLIIVQGVEQYEGDWYWWGGNLTGAGDYPVRLDHPEQLVYSTHVYGPGVYPQPWFSDPEFPENLPGIWESHWAYLVHENIAPVIIGEFGGRSVGEDAEGIWQRTLVSYLRDNNLSYYYWTLNPNSGDTGGLLLDDWQSIDTEKQDLLSDYQFPSIGSEGPIPEAIEEPPSPEPVQETPAPINIDPQTLSVKYKAANLEEQSQDSKPEFVIYNSGTAAIPLDR